MATSGYYRLGRVLALVVPLLSLCVGLVAFGILLLVRAARQLQRLDRRIEELKQKSGPFADAIV